MSNTWADRHRILLMTQTRRRLKNLGYTAGRTKNMEKIPTIHFHASSMDPMSSVALAIFRRLFQLWDLVPFVFQQKKSSTFEPKNSTQRMFFQILTAHESHAKDHETTKNRSFCFPWGPCFFSGPPFCPWVQKTCQSSSRNLTKMAMAI